MDNAAHKLLESTTQRTLHAYGFSRASSQASGVATDLLSRYLTLLASTCAKYAQHSGRVGITPQDALCALGELGVTQDELSDFHASEGNELRRFAVRTTRRAEDLSEFKARLAHGLRQDRDDAILLRYAPIENMLPSDESEAEDSEHEVEDEVIMALTDADESGDNEPASVIPEDSFVRRRIEPPTAQPYSSPPLPLSPVSNPSSPARKRTRTNTWQPQSHIPEFLPPFPSDEVHAPDALVASPLQLPPLLPPPVKVEKPPALLAGLSSTSDYLTRVPYSQSSLSSTPEWHLPSPAPPQMPQPNGRRLLTPQTQPSLISAYHHILTHPPPSNNNHANPARHKVAMSLLSLTQSTSRWDNADTLFSSVVPCAPRVAAIGPTFPMPIGKEEDKDRRLPQAFPRPVSATERLTPLVSQQPSRIPDLARLSLPSTVYTRTTKLHHPGILARGEKKLTYGPGVPAPWNANTTPMPIVTQGKDSRPPIGLPNGGVPGTAAKPFLQDALLYATWDYEAKSYREPLPVGRRGRTGSLQQTSSSLTLSLGTGHGRS